MNLIFRFLWTLIRSARRSKIGPLETSELVFRVLPNDLDVNLHMNNGRYLTIMDLGRLDLILRNGLFAAMRRNGWNPVIAAARINYRRSLDPFQRYSLKTCVIGWDDISVYMEQAFVAGGKIHARAIIRAVFLGGRGRVPTRDLARSLGMDETSPDLDPAIIEILRPRDKAADMGGGA